MVESILVSSLVGLLWGLAVSLFNSFIANRVVKNPAGKMGILIFVFRQAINFLAMFLVYKNTAMLIGTAIGLLVLKNFILMKSIKEVAVQKRKE